MRSLHRVTDRPSEATIRAERPGDEPAIYEVVAAAFGRPEEARLVDAIRASEEFVPELSLVAERDGRIVGHVMISHSYLREGEVVRRIASLAPLAVAPDVQRAGIGSALVRAVTACAEEMGEPLVVLEGSPDYYGRFGSEHSERHGIHIDLPSWAPPEAAQVLRLAGYEPSMRGLLVYSAAFDGVIEH